MAQPLDDTDRTILRTLRQHPRASITEIARRAGLARGTLYARLERMERDGVIVGWGPELDTRAAGYDVVAFVSLQIAQGAHDETIGALAELDELLEIHTITGDVDLLCKVVARSNDHLHEIVLAITALPPVRHSQTQLALHTSHRRGLVDVL